jgi:diacylglycerol kinase family enzyme
VDADANGRFFCGGMELAPGAYVDDGAFEVLSVAPMPLRALLDLLRHLYRGGPRPGDGVVRTSAARVRVEPADWGGPVLLEIDGDALGMLPAEFEIAKAALRFRC